MMVVSLMGVAMIIRIVLINTEAVCLLAVLVDLMG